MIAFVLSCISNGLYFLWSGVLLMFPPILHYQQQEYKDNIDIHFFLVIPCLNEEKVIAKTVNNILSLNMPNTTVVVINDGSTDNTLRILNDIKSEHLHIVNRIPPNARQGKGKALNDAYKQIRLMIDERDSDISKVDMGINEAFTDIVKIANIQGIDHSKVVIGILDADTFIKRSLLERVAVIMDSDPKAGMVQARVRIGTSTRDYFLPLMQDIEFYSYINQMQNVREYMGTVAAAGNGQFNRLSAMEELGEEPWSQCLLEDFDFSLRLLLQGWRTRLLQDETVYQQGVKNYKKYIKQRTRWVQGCIQCVPYLKRIIKSKYLSIPGKIEITYFMMLPWIGLMSTFAMMFSWALILYSYLSKSNVMINILHQYNTSELIMLLVVLFTIIYLPGLLFSIYYWKDTREGLLRCLLAGIFIPIYNMFQMPAVAQAVYRQMVGKNAWVKTERV